MPQINTDFAYAIALPGKSFLILGAFHEPFFEGSLRRKKRRQRLNLYEMESHPWVLYPLVNHPSDTFANEKQFVGCLCRVLRGKT
jgi:hypothetical protein